MMLFIDGYNLLKQIFTTHISMRERKAFIVLLGRYKKKKGHAIFLFFDGGDFLYPFQEKSNGLSIIYSGYRQSADEVIEGFLKQYMHHDVLLITSDRALRETAKKMGIETLGVLPFYQKMTEILGEDGIEKEVVEEVHKMHPKEKNPMLDALMMEASKHLVYKKEDDHKPKEPLKKGASFTLSRKKRKKMKKMEKL